MTTTQPDDPTIVSPELAKKLLIARSKIILEAGLFSPFIIYLRDEKFQPYTQKEIEMLGGANMPLTASVDHRGKMRFYPPFFEKLEREAIEYIIKHEIFHIALLHVGRGLGMKSHDIWNTAIDIKVNDLLSNEYGLGDAPAGGIKVNNQRTYTEVVKGKKLTVTGVDRKSAEEIYLELYNWFDKNDMIQEIENIVVGGPGNKGLRGPGSDGHIHSDELGEGAGTEAEADGHEREVRAQLASAMTSAKMKGNLPAGVQRLIDELLEPKVNWRTYIRRNVEKLVQYDYSYRRPSRRSHSAGVFLPHSIKEGHDVVIAVDLSGSIGEEEMKDFMSECVGMAKQMPALKMTIISHDTTVHSVHEINYANENNIFEACQDLRGGGGTSHADVYRWVKENKPMARLVVCMTDGYSDIQSLEPPGTFNIIWALTTNSVDPKSIPYGTTVKIE